MSNKYEQNFIKLNNALDQKRLLIIQISCTDISQSIINITSISIRDRFTGREYRLLGNQPFFRYDFVKFLKEHKEYSLLIWNYNSTYGFPRFDLGLSNKEIEEIESRIIDFDAVLHEYANQKKQVYLPKSYTKGKLDKRYYFGLINKIDISEDWITGGNEVYISDLELLYKSSREKVNVMDRLLTKFIKNDISLGYDNKNLNNTKKIMGWYARFKKRSKYANFAKDIIMFIFKAIISWAIPFGFGYLVKTIFPN